MPTSVDVLTLQLRLPGPDPVSWLGAHLVADDDIEPGRAPRTVVVLATLLSEDATFLQAAQPAWWPRGIPPRRRRCTWRAGSGVGWPIGSVSPGRGGGWTDLWPPIPSGGTYTTTAGPKWSR